MTDPAQPFAAMDGLRFHWTPASLLVSTVMLTAVVVVCLMGWWKSGRQGSHAWLEAVRFLIALVVVMLLAQPEWVTLMQPTAKPDIAVLVDDSASMGTVDVPVTAPQDDGQSGAVAGAASRRETVASLLEPGFWERIGDRFTIRTSSFPATGQQAGTAGTDLFSPLDSVIRGVPNLRAVVLASDGDWNEGRPPLEAATALRLAGIPVMTVPVGSLTPLPDLSIASLDCAVTGVAGKPFRIPFSIRSTLPREQAATVLIETSDGQRFSKAVRLASMGKTTDAVYWTPAETGDFTVTVSISPQAGELTTDNNSRAVPVAIRQERLRVLVVESVPRWEYRYLRNALARDPGVEVSCLLFHPELTGVGGGSPDYLQRFPSSLDELAAFDVVFLGDVGLVEGQLTEEDCRLLKGLVEYQASGLVFMPGYRGNQQSLVGSALEELIPVTLDEARPEGTGTQFPGRFALTDKGRSSLLTRLSDTVEDNLAVWDALPGFQWYGPVLRAKVGTEVLAVHDDAANEYGRIPLLVTRPFGAGKVLFMGTDGAWRWRKGVEDKYHYRFWGQVVRWMAYRRTMAKGKLLRLLYAPEQPEVGQIVSLDAMVSDASGEPIMNGRVTVDVTSASGNRQTVGLSAPGEQGAWGVFSGAWAPQESGKHQLVLSCPEAGEPLVTEVFVQAMPTEATGDPARPDVLEEISRVTQGRMIASNDLDQLLDALANLPENPPEERRLRLWAHPAALAVVIGLLGLFWILRKWKGLL